MQVLKQEILEKIIKVSERMFYDKGYRNSSTRNIAKEVGISCSNLYRYFKNKEELFYTITRDFYNNMKNGFNDFINHKESDEFNPELIKKIASIFSDIIINEKIKFVIVMNRCEGTKYEGLKKMIIESLNNHIIKLTAIKSKIVVDVLSKNFINGILDIATICKSAEDIRRNIQFLVDYHIAGIKKLVNKKLL